MKPSQLQPGDRIRENDPRFGHPEAEIVDVGEQFVTIRRHTGKITKVSVANIFCDGKKRNRGYSLACMTGK